MKDFFYISKDTILHNLIKRKFNYQMRNLIQY